LSSNIPELKSNQGVVIVMYHLESKIYADSGSVVLSEEVMHVSFNQGGFATAKLPNNKDLE